jgi:hypothetical protein
MTQRNTPLKYPIFGNEIRISTRSNGLESVLL